jgi:aminopeptidase N
MIMKKVTKRWLKKMNACCSESDMDRAEKNLKGNIVLITKTLLAEDRFSDANWLVTRLMNKKQNVQCAIFAAEQVLPIFEEKYPNSNSPRKAIEAAKNYLKNPCEITKNAVDYAARAAACVAARAAACAAARAAARAACAAAYAAAYATDAAYAAYAAADAAYAAYADKKDLKIKIINKGLEILKKG